MSRLRLSALAVLLACSAPTHATQAPAPPSAPSVDQIRLTESKAIIDVMFPPPEREATFARMMNDITGPMRQQFAMTGSSDPGFRALTDAALDKVMANGQSVVRRHLPRLFDAMAHAYAREFTLAELRDIHAFARTPAGSRYLQRSPTLVGDPGLQQVNREMMVDAQASSKAITDEYKAKIIAYLTANPGAAARIAAERAK